MDVLRKAEELLESEIPTIVDYPAPQSRGGLHDYYSEGIYWHPDKTAVNGYPYVRRDGVVNRKSFTSHKKILEELKRNTSVLYKAYSETHDVRYARKIEENLYRFFVNEDTRMNPNMKYAEAVPGLFEGRSIGIMDSLKLIEIPSMVMRLNDEGVLSDGLRAGVAAWFSEYASWLDGLEDLDRNPSSCCGSSYFLQISVFSGID